MPKLFETALAEFKKEIRNAVKEVPLNEKDLNAFIELFATDFSQILDNDRGAAIWRRDRRRIKRLGRYVGTIAEFFAVAPVKESPVRMAHLARALEVMQPECKLQVPPTDLGPRKDWCRSVKVKKTKGKTTLSN